MRSPRCLEVEQLVSEAVPAMPTASIQAAKLTIPGTDLSWLSFEHVDGEEVAVCWLCKQVARTPAEKAAKLVRGCDAGRLDNIGRHADAKQHMRALRELGYLEAEGEDESLAPSISQFRQTLERLPGQAFRSGVKGVGGEAKVKKMVSCLGDAASMMDCEILKNSWSILLQCDIKELRLAVRYQCCTADLQVRRGLLGIEDVESKAHDQVMLGVQRCLEKVCSCNGQLDQDALSCIRDRVEVLNADGASDAQLALAEMRRSAFPNILFILRDKAHASRRLLSRPWHAIPQIHEVYDMIIGNSASFTSKIQHSDVLTRVFQRNIQEMQAVPSTAKRIKNLSLARHRFDSCQKPLSRFCLYLEAYICTAIEAAADPGKKGHLSALTFLEWATEDRLLLLSLLAECAEENLVLIRYFDREGWDAATLQYHCQVHASKLRYLFVQGRAFESGYTAHVIAQLQTAKGFMVKGVRKTLGGRPITDATRERCLEIMQLYTRLALETMEAEMPGFETLASLRVMNVSSGSSREQVQADAQDCWQNWLLAAASCDLEGIAADWNS